MTSRALNLPWARIRLVFPNLNTSWSRKKSSLPKKPPNSLNGFVGGVVNGETKTLTPALRHIDQTYNSGAILDQINNFDLLPRSSKPEIFYAIFEQQKHAIAVSRFGDIRILQNPSAHVKKTRNVYRSFVRTAVAAGVQELQNRGIRFIQVDPFQDAEAAAEAAYLSSFVYDELKSLHRPTRPSIRCYLDHLRLNPTAGDKDSVLAAWRRGTHFATAQNMARKWMETPANLLTPTDFAEQAKTVLEGVADAPIQVNIRDRDWCEAQQMNGFLAVAAGSHQKAVFLEIIYEGDPERSPNHVALVGKGVTFDSGGVSIKPSAGMGDMRADMGGAAVVVATIFGLANLRIPLNVRAYIPLCENMPGGGAVRPGDVIRFSNGLTVEVDNTDAEGRLLLADGILMAHRHPDLQSPPAMVLDVATLTGAIAVALGDVFFGLFAPASVKRQPFSWSSLNPVKPTSPAAGPIVDDITECKHLPQFEESGPPCTLFAMFARGCFSRDDLFWPMPILSPKELQEQSETADLLNSLKGDRSRVGGACVAAGFLGMFVSPSVPWIHCDIAGVMKAGANDSVLRKGMTGRPTRSLIEFLENVSKS